jgi:hypothetical protein
MTLTGTAEADGGGAGCALGSAASKNSPMAANSNAAPAETPMR